MTANDEGIEVAPMPVTWSVSGETAATDGEPLDLNSATRVDRLGVLHVQKTGLEAANVLHVTGTTSYVNRPVRLRSTPRPLTLQSPSGL